MIIVPEVKYCVSFSGTKHLHSIKTSEFKRETTYMNKLVEIINSTNLIATIAALIAIFSAIYKLYRWYKNKPKNILFIDDEIKDFAIVNTLRKNKYNIDTLEDVEDLEGEKIKKAKIIFVDFKGVGKKFGKQQGIDLIKALKAKYKNKKTIILFSAHSGFSLTHDLQAGDENIAKNASTQDFIDMINKHL